MKEKKKFICIILFSISIIACGGEDKMTSSETFKKKVIVNKERDRLGENYVEYYDNGIERVISGQEKGELHGAYSKFNSDGSLSEEGIMRNGLRNGVWKSYNKKGKLKSVKQYYNDSLLFDLDQLDFNFREVTIGQKGLKISVSKGWETSKKEMYPVILVSKKKCDDSVIFCSNITVVKDSLRDGVDFNTYLQLNYDLLQNQFNNFRLIARGNIKVGDFSAFQITYLMQTDGVKLGGITTWIKNGEIIYVITGLALNEGNSDFLKYKGLFQEITSSLSVDGNM